MLGNAALSEVLPATTSDVSRPGRPPVFVLSAGWRSGSTAVQRLIVSGGEAFVWGEPYPTGRLLARLTRMAAEATAADNGTERVLVPEDVDRSLSQRWIAISNPPSSAVVQGVRAMLESTYWPPVADSEFTTWGTKEVALTRMQIDTLALAFPDAHFVCVVRNPVDAYRSFRRFVVSGVTTTDSPSSPLRRVAGPRAYGQVWRDMAETFRQRQSDPRFHVYRHEDIAGQKSFPADLGRRLDMRLDPGAWSSIVGSRASPVRVGAIERIELRILRSYLRSEARMWEYQI